MGYVSVDNAIAKGHRMVNYPLVIIFFAVSCISFYLVHQQILPFWMAPLGIFLSFIVCWLYWSIMITKWRLWAFENVKNVHELEKRAEQERLIWPTKSAFEKTEIRTVLEQKKWKLLQEKFKHEDVFIDDLSIPHETLIYFSKRQKFIQIGIGIVLLAVGLYHIIIIENYLGILFSILGVFMAYIGLRDVSNNEPQIIINNNGIKTAKSDFAEWKDILSEEVMMEKSGKSRQKYLVYSHLKGFEKINIEDLDTDVSSLSKLLNIYRKRNELAKR